MVSKKPKKNSKDIKKNLPDIVPKTEAQLRKKLTFKQKKFVKEYMVDLNAKGAAVRAGYSEKSAHVIGHDLLKHPLVRTKIQKELTRILKNVDAIKGVAVRTLLQQALGDIRDIVDWGNDRVTLKDSSELTREQANMIEEIEEKVNNGGVSSVKVKFASRQKALELLGKYLSFFTEKHEHTGTVEHDHKHSLSVKDLTDEELETMRNILRRKKEKENVIDAEVVE